MREPAAARLFDRTLSFVAIALGIALAVVLPRVPIHSAPARPAQRGGVVVIGPLGLLPMGVPVNPR
jgi:uncharacterized membrane protein